MKRSNTYSNAVFILTILLAISNITYGQYSIQFIGGVNMNKLHTNDPDLNELNPYEFTQGVFAGTAVTYRINPDLRLAGEFLYAQKGSENTFAKESRKFITRLHSIDILPGVQYSPIRLLELGAGLDIGIPITEKIKSQALNRKGPSHPDDGIWKKPVATTYDNVDLSAYLSVGARYNDLLVFVRYSHGISKVGRIAVTDAQGGIRSWVHKYNRQVQLGLNLDFPIHNPDKVTK